MGKRLRYQVAVSLDGFIAGPNGEYDWIVMDPTIDFNALYKQFDTVVMGRKTYEVATAQSGYGAVPGMEVVVFSRTLQPATYPGVRIVNDDPGDVVQAQGKAWTRHLALRRRRTLPLSSRCRTGRQCGISDYASASRIRYSGHTSRTVDQPGAR